MLVSCRINHKSNVKSYKFVFFWLQSWSTSYLKSRTSGRGEDTTQCNAEFVSKAPKGLFFDLIVLITAENMSCIQIKQQMLALNENSACTFHIRWNE